MASGRKLKGPKLQPLCVPYLHRSRHRIPTDRKARPKQTLVEQFSYLHVPKPFKNPSYTKNQNRRAKNLKTVLTQEREREKQDRERRRLEAMDVDGVPPLASSDNPYEEDTPTCKSGCPCGLRSFPTLMDTQIHPSRHLLRCFRHGSIAISLVLRHVFSLAYDFSSC